MKHVYDYVIVGGLAGASAVEGIREIDAAGKLDKTGIGHIRKCP